MSGIGGRVNESFGALGQVFRNPGLRRLELAFLGSTMGHWTYVVGLSVYAYNQGGTTAVGIISVLRLLPAAIASPFLATLADRYRRERVMMTTDLIRAALMALAAVMIATDGPALVVYAVVILTNLVGVAFRPAQAALLPGLARNPAELSAANVAASTFDAVSTFAGPAIGGIILALWNVQAVFGLNALWFLSSAALLVGLKAPAPAASPVDEEGKRPGYFSELSEGLSSVVSDRNVATVTGLYTAQAFIAGAMNVLVVLVALELVDAGEAGVGYLSAALGVGGFLGGFVALVLATRRRLAADFGLGVVLFGIPFAVIAVFSSYTVALIAFAVVGLGNSVADIAALTLFQRIVPDHVLGRVLGVLEGLLLGAIGLGGLAAPLCISLFGAKASLLAAGLLLPAGTLLAARRLAAIDRTTAAPAHTALLRGVALLGVLPEQVLEFLANAVEPPPRAPGGTIVREGDVGDRFYVIESGEVEILGRRFGPGEAFGEIALLRDVPRTASVTAVGDVTLLTLERDVFVSAVTGHGPAHATAEELVAERLGSFTPLFGLTGSGASSATDPSMRVLLGLLLLLHLLQRGEREALAREEDQPHADADGHLDRLEHQPVGEPGAVGDAVLDERQRHRRLQQADVAGPEREDRRHVHQHEHEPGRRQRQVEVERAHHRPDGEQLHQPADALEERGPERGQRSPQDGEALTSHQHESAQGSHPVVDPALARSRRQQADREQADPDDAEDDQARDRPVRDLRGQQHPGDENRDGEEIEEAVREHRPEQRRARAPPVRHMTAQDGDARQLACPGRQHRVPEQPDPEGREDLPEARVGLGQRLVDRHPPRERSRHHGEEVEEHTHDHPAPGDTVEGVGHGAPVGPAPPDREHRRGEQREHEDAARPGVVGQAEEPGHAERRPSTAIASS